MKTSRFPDIILKRPENMDFEEYKRIRRAQNIAIKNYLRGTLIHESSRLTYDDKGKVNGKTNGSTKYGERAKQPVRGKSGIMDKKEPKKSILMALVTTKAFWIMLAIIIISIILIALL